MERLSGMASSVLQRGVTDVLGDPPASGSHLAQFKLAGRRVQAKSGGYHIIGDGDRLVVVGSMRGGVFEALACRNDTRGTTSNEDWVGRLVVCPLLCWYALRVLGMDIRAFGPLQLALAGVFAVVCAYSVFHGARTLRAVMQLRAGGAAT